MRLVLLGARPRGYHSYGRQKRAKKESHYNAQRRFDSKQLLISHRLAWLVMAAEGSPLVQLYRQRGVDVVRNDPQEKCHMASTVERACASRRLVETKPLLLARGIDEAQSMMVWVVPRLLPFHSVGEQMPT